MTGQGHDNAAAMHTDGVYNVGVGKDLALQSAKAAAPLSAAPTVEHVTAT